MIKVTHRKKINHINLDTFLNATESFGIEYRRWNFEAW